MWLLVHEARRLRAVHRVAVDRPLEEVRDDEEDRHQHPVERARVRGQRDAERRDRRRDRHRQPHVAPGRVAGRRGARRARTGRPPTRQRRLVTLGDVLRGGRRRFGCAIPSSMAYHCAHAVLRRRLEGEPHGARQRAQHRRQGAGAALRLPRHQHRPRARAGGHHHPLVGRAARGGRADRAARAHVQAERLAALPRPQGRRGRGRADRAAARRSSSRASRPRPPRRSSRPSRTPRSRCRPQIQGDELRVTGKNRDDLQAAIAFLRKGDYGLDLQFVNFRD